MRPVIQEAEVLVVQVVAKKTNELTEEIPAPRLGWDASPVLNQFFRRFEAHGLGPIGFDPNWGVAVKRTGPVGSCSSK